MSGDHRHEQYLAETDGQIELLQAMAEDCMTAFAMFAATVVEKGFDAEHVFSQLAQLHLTAGACLNEAAARLTVIRTIQTEFPPGDPRLSDD